MQHECQRSKGDSAILNAAILDGAIDPIWPALTGMDRQLARALRSPQLRPRPVRPAETQRPAQHGRAMQPIEAVTNYTSLIGDAATGIMGFDNTMIPIFGWWFELCRFIVPWGFFGAVRNLAIFAHDYTDPAGAPPPVDYQMSDSANWGSPWHLSPSIMTITRKWRFHLRLCTIADFGNPIFQAQNFVVPGIPYPPRAKWSGLQYPWDSPQDLWWPVDGGQALRLFAYAQPYSAGPGADPEYIEIGARMRGFIQAESIEATRNTRSGWS